MRGCRQTLIAQSNCTSLSFTHVTRGLVAGRSQRQCTALGALPRLRHEELYLPRSLWERADRRSGGRMKVNGLLQQVASPLYTSAQHQRALARPAFAFASASSTKTVLQSAIDDCVASVRAALGSGRPPQLVQLLVTAGTYGTEVGNAPHHAWRLLHEGDGHEMTLIGGAVASTLRGAGGGGGGGVTSVCAGVTLMAAHLPGVRVAGFRCERPSLPALPSDLWAALLRSEAASTKSVGAAAAGSQDHTASAHERTRPARSSAAAAILLSTPHFMEVEQLLRRLGAALPRLPVLGGVTQPAAWGPRDETGYGAVFLNDAVFGVGAVGCMLHGGFTLRLAAASGYRGVGPVHTVTASHDNIVIELDGTPAFKHMIDTLSTLDRSASMSLKAGLDTTAATAGADGGGGASAGGEEHGPLLTRDLFFPDADSPLISVAVDRVPEGSRIQLQREDQSAAAAALRSRLQQAVSASCRESPSVRKQSPAAEQKMDLQAGAPSSSSSARHSGYEAAISSSPVGALAYSCISFPAQLLEAALDDAAQLCCSAGTAHGLHISGGAMQGEFVPAVALGTSEASSTEDALPSDAGCSAAGSAVAAGTESGKKLLSAAAVGSHLHSYTTAVAIISQSSNDTA